MLKIAVVEDELREQNTMKNYISRYFSERKLEAETFVYSDGDEFLDEYPSPDIVLMDIEMKRMDGLSAARKLRSFDEHVLLLFVTNMVHLALEGYEVDASDFIIKPLSYESFCARMDKTMRKLETQQERYIEVHSGKVGSFINLRDLCYAEAVNKKTVLHLQDGNELTVTDPIYQLEDKLSDSGFFRCHSAFLVNLHAVRSVSTAEVFIGTQAIPVSKHRKKEFLTALANYRGRML